MSQLIACKNNNGIVLAVDSRSVGVDISGELIESEIERLHALSKNTVILCGGASAGEEICRSLKEFVHNENLIHIDEVYPAALPFLASAYERFMAKNFRFQPLDPTHQIHFILAGYTPHNPDHRHQMYLMWTKRKLPQLDGEQIGNVFTVPRSIRLEHRLNTMAQENQPLDRIISVVRERMEQQAAQDDEVGGPFHYALITAEGIQRL